MTNVGSYTGSASPYGTFDQGGNVYEWNETIAATGSSVAGRGLRGGFWGSCCPSSDFAAGGAYFGYLPGEDDGAVGFRVAMIPGGYVPEPGTGLLVIAGLLGLAGWRRARE